MATYQYRVVDVFTSRPLEGNPLAVFPNATGLDTATMQRIARELNLSETVFVFPPVRLRIFTPQREMDFAGHPTIGTAYVLVSGGLTPPGSRRILLEENIGPVPVRIQEGAEPFFWLTTPPIESGGEVPREVAAEAIGLPVDDLLEVPPQCLSAGNPAVLIGLRDREAVGRAWLDAAGMAKLAPYLTGKACVFVFAPTAEGAYSRMFAPDYGIVEDPATGSVTGPLAAYMKQHGLTKSDCFVSEQGTKMGRKSLLHVRMTEQGIEVGGTVTPLIDAVLHL